MDGYTTQIEHRDNEEHDYRVIICWTERTLISILPTATLPVFQTGYVIVQIDIDNSFWIRHQQGSLGGYHQVYKKKSCLFRLRNRV